MNKYFKNGFGLSLLVLMSLNSFSQKFACKGGQTSFFSETPMENIQAENTKVVSMIDPATGVIAVKMTIRDFEFPNKLMQEHFNENYLESEKYPTAVFSGKILGDVDYDKDGTYPVTGQGNMIIHGVKKEISLKGTLNISGDQLNLKAEYLIKPEDYRIEIPSLVITKIAEEISVKSNFTYTRLSK